MLSLNTSVKTVLRESFVNVVNDFRPFLNFALAIYCFGDDTIKSGKDETIKSMDS